MKKLFWALLLAAVMIPSASFAQGWYTHGRYGYPDHRSHIQRGYGYGYGHFNRHRYWSRYRFYRREHRWYHRGAYRYGYRDGRYGRGR